MVLLGVVKDEVREYDGFKSTTPSPGDCEFLHQELDEELAGEHPGPVNLQHHQVGGATCVGAHYIF